MTLHEYEEDRDRVSEASDEVDEFVDELTALLVKWSEQHGAAAEDLKSRANRAIDKLQEASGLLADVVDELEGLMCETTA